MGRAAVAGGLTAATMSSVDEQHRIGQIREEISARAAVIRAELAARVDEHDVRLGDHDRRLDGHDEQLSALEDKVDAMADIHVRAHQAENIPVPPALRPESPLRLVGSEGNRR